MKQGDHVQLIINKLGKHGEGIAHSEGLPIFVEHALPHEKIQAKIILVKKSYASAQLLRIISPNEKRVTPSCSHFETCGGCQIMHLSYDEQLEQKHKLVKEALKNTLATKDSFEIFPCLASPQPFNYRNKIQLPVTQRASTIVSGFYKRGTHEVVPYDRCLVHHSIMERSAHNITQLIQNSMLRPYCESTQTGSLRHFILRANSKNEILVGLVTNGTESSHVRNLAQSIKTLLPNIVGVVENINQRKQNTILGEETNTLCGKPYLREEIDGLLFNTSLASFFQVNLHAAKILYQIALNFAQLTKNSIVLDACCGIGTMTLLASRLCKEVIGVECVPQAVVDAQENARINNIHNARFITAKIEDKTELFQGIDCALLNPPRKGLDQKVCQALDTFGPKRLVYISCNPHTLARDAQLLTRYSLKKIQPVDMFPQTMHVESVALFERI